MESKIKHFSMVCDKCGSKEVKLRWSNLAGFLRFFITCKSCGAYEDAEVGIIP